MSDKLLDMLTQCEENRNSLMSLLLEGTEDEIKEAAKRYKQDRKSTEDIVSLITLLELGDKHDAKIVTKEAMLGLLYKQFATFTLMTMYKELCFDLHAVFEQTALDTSQILLVDTDPAEA